MEGTGYENETSITTSTAISTTLTTTPASISTTLTTTPASISTTLTTTPASISTTLTTTPASISTALKTTPASISTASTTAPASISKASTTRWTLTSLKSRSTGVETFLIVLFTCLGVVRTAVLCIFVVKLLRAVYPKFGSKVVDKKPIDIEIIVLNEMPSTPDRELPDTPKIVSSPKTPNDHLKKSLSQREFLSDPNAPELYIELRRNRIKK